MTQAMREAVVIGQRVGRAAESQWLYSRDVAAVADAAFKAANREIVRMDREWAAEVLAVALRVVRAYDPHCRGPVIPDSPFDRDVYEVMLTAAVEEMDRTEWEYRVQ